MAFNQREHARNLKIKYQDAVKDYQSAHAAYETFKAKMDDSSKFDQQMLGVTVHYRDSLEDRANGYYAEWQAAITA